MNYSFTDATANGVATTFSFSFVGDGKGYLRDSDVHVFVDGVEVSYTLTGENQVTLSPAPANGALVRIRRIMPKDTIYAQFNRGITFNKTHLNNSFLQSLYVVHEFLDGFLDEFPYVLKGDMEVIGSITCDGLITSADIDVLNNQIKNLAYATDAGDAVPLAQVLEIASQAQGANFVSETKPLLAFSGMRWYKPSDASTYVWYVDADSGQWIEESVQSAEGTLRGELLLTQLASKKSIPFDSVADMQAKVTSTYVGRRVHWHGYHTESDGGSGWGIVKSGAHVADGGSIITISPTLYVEQNLKGNKISTRKFGAKIDSNFNASNTPTDDTAAVQALIDFLDGDEYSVLYSPTGFCMVTQLVAKAGIKIKGDGAGISYFIQPVGETQSILTDNGTAANLFIEDIAFDCNNNTIPNAAVYLGYGGQQMGVVAGFRQVFVRNVDGNGVSINGNVIVVDWLETYFCTGTGVIIDGEGNKYNKIITSNCGTIGIHIKGSSNEVYNSHYETACATACCLVGANTVGNVVNGVKITGVGGNIHGAGVKIETNASNFSIRDVRASLSSSANVANGLIYDLSGGTRRIWGLDTGGVSFLVPDYTGGSRVQLPYKSSTPPTTGTHRQGDWFISGVGAEGVPIGWICSAGGTPGTFSPMETNAGAINKAANETLAATDVGKRFKNETAAAIITLTLPVVGIGSRIHFTRRNGTHALRIDPNGSQLIRPGGVGKYLSLDTDGASVTLEYMSANSWCIVAQSGTVSFEP